MNCVVKLDPCVLACHKQHGSGRYKRCRDPAPKSANLLGIWDATIRHSNLMQNWCTSLPDIFDLSRETKNFGGTIISTLPFLCCNCFASGILLVPSSIQPQKIGWPICQAVCTLPNAFSLCQMLAISEISHFNKLHCLVRGCDNLVQRTLGECEAQRYVPNSLLFASTRLRGIEEEEAKPLELTTNPGFLLSILLHPTTEMCSNFCYVLLHKFG